MNFYQAPRSLVCEFWS